MDDLSKTVSEYIERQFPAVYREDGDNLIAFVKAYFEFLENGTYSSTTLSRNMFSHRDIDTTLDEFLHHFNSKYLSEFPYVKTVDNRFAVKHIMDFYRSKGTPRSAELLIKFLFNSEATIYYPGNDVFTLSDSKWFIPTYLEVNKSSLTAGFVDKQITGSISGATAYVEGVITKRINGRFIDIVYISSLKGNFVTGELISDGIYLNAPRVIGSLTTVSITSGGSGNAIGDIFNVISNDGLQGQVRLTELISETGKLTFSITDGGSGYTLDANTVVYVSNQMMGVNNTNSDFVKYETIIQNRSTLNLSESIDANEVYASNSAVTDYLVGMNTAELSYSANGTGADFARSTDIDHTDLYVLVSNGTLTDTVVANTDYSTNTTHVIFNTPPEASANVRIVEYSQVANGVIYSYANTDVGGNTVITASSYSKTEVQSQSGSFLPRYRVDFAGGNTDFASAETVTEESAITLEVNTITGSFSATDIAEVYVYSAASEIGSDQVIIDYGRGTVATSNSTHITLTNAWGSFTAGETIAVYTANGSTTGTANIVTSTVTIAGSVGTIVQDLDSNTWIIEMTSGTLAVGNSIRGNSSKEEGTISDLFDYGANEVWYNGNNALRATITASVNTSATGVLVGQNTTVIGISSTSNTIYFVEGAGLEIETDRAANNITKELTSINTGSGAGYTVASLTDTEIVNINTDDLSSTNIVGQSWLNINADGSNSGVGYLSSIAIGDGGNSYSNGQYLLSGGGIANGSPYINAAITVGTDGSGVITSIVVDNAGEGYYSEPTLTLSPGSSANLTLNMTYGYGYTRNPYGNANTDLEDMWTFANSEIGTIGAIISNPGSDYNTDLFTSVYNELIAGYNYRNYRIDMTVSSSSFAVGENVLLDGNVVGEVISANSTVLFLKRTIFEPVWSANTTIAGATTGAIATINTRATDATSEPMGDNAVIGSDITISSGAASIAEIIDSGYGYIDAGVVTLEKTGATTIDGIAYTGQQGIGTGYWTTTASHASDTSKIHDNKYYQEYSYDIQSDISLSKYRDIAKKVLHVAGTELFGSVIKNTGGDINITAIGTTIETE